MDFKILKERFNRLDTACVCDANKRLRVMDPGIRPIDQGIKMVGIARTVHCKNDFLAIIKALSEAKEDEVLVIDAEGDRIAVAGELFTMEAKRKGLSGIVIDGGFRDVRQAREINFPVYARYITPMAGTSTKIFSTQAEIKCGGVSVSPGDIMLGDDDGIVIMNEKEVTEILDTAEGIQQREERVFRKMKEGVSLIDLLNFTEHYEKVSKKEESKLTFII
ncbi:MAG: RraA family protein [Candidatus Aminicenantes bacterium]|nr:RraA family protein [Candidatus Aminicenantes bacterium]